MKTDQLTFTRFIAAIAVVFYHFSKKTTLFSYTLIRIMILNGHIGVSYFFILSGFVMILAYGKEKKNISKSNYYINRFARIYPMYLLALLCMVIILSLNHSFSYGSLIFHGSALQAWFPSIASNFNPVGW